tara:strand:- start:226 stop:384 length:159 start_codon:yes stop_codon:yes gene_type:complete
MTKINYSQFERGSYTIAREIYRRMVIKKEAPKIKCDCKIKEKRKDFCCKDYK